MAVRAATLAAAALALAACGGDPPPARPPSPPPAAPAARTPFDPASATAVVRFRAVAKGPLPRMRAVKFDSDPACGKLQTQEVLEEGIVAKDGRLANVIVHAARGAERWTYPAAEEDVVLDQVGCTFLPHVLTLRVGQPLVIRNSDPTLHNTHSVPKVNPEFNRTQVQGAGDITEKFTKEEVGVRIKCDVHGWMVAWAGVFSHPFHGVTGADGTAEIRVPPGAWEFAAWHEFTGFSRPPPAAVTLAAGETKEIEFVFEAPAK